MKIITLSLLLASFGNICTAAEISTDYDFVTWNHNSGTYVAYHSGTSVIDNISDETYGGSYSSIIDSSASVVTGVTGLGYIEYQFDVNYTPDTTSILLNYFFLPEVADTTTINDPDTMSGFVSHFYDATVSISADSFATSGTELIFGDDVNPLGSGTYDINQIFLSNSTFGSSYELEDNTTYTIRVELSDLAPGDDSIVFDDFRLQYGHTTEVASVPEPSSMILSILGLLALGMRRQRR